MSISCGFYNSVNGDRKYNTEQISAIFDGIINDGVFAHVDGYFQTTPSEGMSVVVAPGRAWFDHTWTRNDAPLPLTLDPSEIVLDRIDAVILEVNSSNDVRDNTIKVLKGIPGSAPSKPELTNTEDVHQYPLAYIDIVAGTQSISTECITIMVGQEPCPFVTAILETTDITDLLAKWEAEFNYWFENVKTQLDGDVALNLQKQIDDRVKISDKASIEEARLGTENAKWMSPALVKEAIESLTYSVGDVLVSRRLEIGPNWLLCNGSTISRTEYPELSDVFGIDPSEFKYIKKYGAVFADGSSSTRATSLFNYDGNEDGFLWCGTKEFTSYHPKIIIAQNSNVYTISDAFNSGATAIGVIKKNNHYIVAVLESRNDYKSTVIYYNTVLEEGIWTNKAVWAAPNTTHATSPQRLRLIDDEIILTGGAPSGSGIAAAIAIMGDTPDSAWSTIILAENKLGVADSDGVRTYIADIIKTDVYAAAGTYVVDSYTNEVAFFKSNNLGLGWTKHVVETVYNWTTASSGVLGLAYCDHKYIIYGSSNGKACLWYSDEDDLTTWKKYSFGISVPVTGLIYVDGWYIVSFGSYRMSSGWSSMTGLVLAHSRNLENWTTVTLVPKGSSDSYFNGDIGEIRYAQDKITMILGYRSTSSGGAQIKIEQADVDQLVLPMYKPDKLNAFIKAK